VQTWFNPPYYLILMLITTILPLQPQNFQNLNYYKGQRIHIYSAIKLALKSIFISLYDKKWG